MILQSIKYKRFQTGRYNRHDLVPFTKPHSYLARPAYAGVGKTPPAVKHFQ